MGNQNRDCVRTVTKGWEVLFFHSSWALVHMLSVFPWRPLDSEIWGNYKFSLRCSWSVLFSGEQNQCLNISSPLGKNFPTSFSRSDGNTSYWTQNQPDACKRARWVLRIAVMFRFLLIALITMARVSLRVDKSIIGLSSFLLHRSAKNHKINQLVERHPWRCMGGRRCE